MRDCARSEDDTIGDLKKLVAAQTGTRPEKIRIQKWCAGSGVFHNCLATCHASSAHAALHSDTSNC